MSRPAGGWADPPHYTPHALEQMWRKKIPKDAADLVCMTCHDAEFDEENDSYEMSGRVAGGRLEVAVTAESYLEGDRLVVKTAYWLERTPG